MAAASVWVFRQHAGVVIVCDGTDAAAARIARVLRNDPGTGVMRHADAGYSARSPARARRASTCLGTLMAALTLKPGSISLAQLRRISRGADALALAEGWRGSVEASLAAVRARLAAGESLYGINTGFGKLAKTRISDDELATLQLYLMRSHAAGVGAPLADSTVRMILVLKAASLARGFSGVRAIVIERLLALVKRAASIPSCRRRARLAPPVTSRRSRTCRSR